MHSALDFCCTALYLCESAVERQILGGDKTKNEGAVVFDNDGLLEDEKVKQEKEEDR